MALIALTLTLAGPSIRAGFGRLELEQSSQAIRSFVKAGRVQAQRADREYHVVIYSKRDSMALLDPELKVVRKETLPSSVQIILDSDSLFFQAEDGIRDFTVTGVQTCALPI